MKRLPTVMAAGHKFSQVPSVQIERSVLDRSHGHKLTFDSGLLIPVFLDEIVPGDTMTLRMSAFCRLATPRKPFMDNLYLDSFFFFVPMRLAWANWVKFMGEQTSPGDSIAFTIPTITVPFTPQLGSIMDYLGVMPQATATAVQTPNAVSSLPLRCYWLIYNQWFRDQNLVTSPHAIVPTGDGPDAFSGTTPPAKRGKRHDYFTSCLPFLQKGTASSSAVTPVPGIPTWKTSGGSNVLNLVAPGADLGNVTGDYTSGVPAAAAMEWIDPKLQVFINDLRLATQIQKLLERDARGGTRYTEIIWSHFRVKSPDARLQRPEYLGGGSSPIMISPISQMTQASTPATPTNQDALGNLSAQAAVFARGHGFTKSFTEHGYIIGIINVRADLTYQQGLERMWSRRTRYDFYWPALAHIGEQAVLSQEIFWDGSTAQNANDVSVFGYQERHAEYRYKPSRISGLFRSNAAGTLEFWHLSEDFAARPTLGATFIEDQTESILDNRVWVTTEPDWYADLYFDYKCARPMPVFGVPGFIDHF